jgi:GrpB-like predicted nucleotidyltransferase (UPF0157 family)
MLIQTYQKSWVDDFDAIKNTLSEALADLDIAIEHVGSTAVPNLAAKPIIDVDIIFKKTIDFEGVKAGLEKIGYSHVGNQGIANREVFKRQETATPHPILDAITHHLYVCPMDSAELERHLLFRDYLRAHESARIFYQNLKIETAEAAQQDRKRYAQLKEKNARDFIDGILEKAKKDKIGNATGNSPFENI